MHYTHRPRYGSNPLTSEPDARYPYAPAPGERVSISIAGSLEGPAPVCTIKTDTGKPQEITAQKGDTCWSLGIGPFGEDERVLYTIPGIEQMFSFHTAQRLHLTGAEIEERGEASLLLRLEFERDVVIRRKVFVQGNTKHVEMDQNGTLSVGGYEEKELFVLFHKDWNPEYRLFIRSAHRCTAFLGLGERFNSVNQIGSRIIMRVYEEYKKQHETNRSYIPVSFFMTDDNWGLYTKTFEPVMFDFDTENDGFWSRGIPFHSKDTVEEYLFAGTPAQILGSYAKASALPVLPPKWVFEPWMSSNEWNSQQRVADEISQAHTCDIPFGVVVIEAWSDEENFYIFNDAVYEPSPGNERLHLEDFSFPKNGLWPDPKGLVDTIHNEGAKLLLWQIPVLKHGEQEGRQHANDRQWMEARGYALKTTDGENYRVRPWWFPNGLVPDFSHPEARAWWLSKRQYLLDELGIDGFKTDGGEHLWGTDVIGTCPQAGDALANRFAHDYLEGYHDLITQKGIGECVLFSRAGSLSPQATPIHWCGDQDSTWEAHRSVLTAVLSGGLSGIPFIGWDLGGFSGPLPDEELYIRSTQMACFGTLMQFHSEFHEHKEPHVDRSPWNMAKHTGDEHIIDVYRYYAKLRMKLGEYLYASAGISATTGLPLMRPLCIDYPEHPEAFTNFTQYQLGPDILVAPVLNPGMKTRPITIPDESWIDGWSGESVKEGSVDYPLEADKIPVFFRKDGELPGLIKSLFPLSPVDAGTRYE